MLYGNLSTVEFIVPHELIHFNQKYNIGPIGKSTLLEQCIKEGSADFIAMLISGIDPNNRLSYKYGNENERQLCREFLEIMNRTSFQGWLYGGSKKDNRPSDLGYWMGYKICESYHKASMDKKKAIKEILNIKDFNEFLEQSGYLIESIKE